MGQEMIKGLPSHNDFELVKVEHEQNILKTFLCFFF